MKNALLLAGLLFSSSLFAAEADSTGLEGDHLDLNAVMEIFKESESPEDFEKKLNSESSNVNNLDLDQDGEVDYIRVIDSGDSTSHALTLQVPVTESESQDVAVIELEETATDSISAQIVGDEELYGANYILVPQATSKTVVFVNVHSWRPVSYMWAPRYKLWVSPWRYRHHPRWYRPWKRKTWRVYHGRAIRHHGHCRRVYKRPFTHAHVHHYHHTHSVTFHGHHHHKHAGKTAGKTTGTKTKTATSPAKKPTTKTATKTTTTKSNGTTVKKKQTATKGKTSTGQKKTTTQKKKTTSGTKTSTQKKSSGQKSSTRKRPGSKTSKKSSSSRKRPGSTNNRRKN